MATPYFTKISEAPVKTMRLERGRTIRLVDPELAGSRHIDLHINEIKVDSGPGPTHYHERSENIYIVLEGTVVVEIEGTRHTFGPNDVAFIPPGVRHRAGNGGDTVARVIEIYAPPGPDFHIVDDDDGPTGGGAGGGGR